MSEPILKVENLHFYYGNIHAVQGISLEVGQEEIVTLIGSNGAGKSTTLQAISGLLYGVCTGDVYFMGENIRGKSSSAIANMGLMQVLEGRHIFPQISVLENLLAGAFIRGKEDTSRELEYVFHLFSILKEREKQMGGTLSGGEQQMLAIGRVLMGKPKMIMLDEPSLGLAPIVVENVFDIIRTIHNDGVPVLLVEQNSVAALGVANRGYVIESGQIAYADTSEALRNNPQVQAAYLGIE